MAFVTPGQLTQKASQHILQSGRVFHGVTLFLVEKFKSLTAFDLKDTPIKKVLSFNQHKDDKMITIHWTNPLQNR